MKLFQEFVNQHKRQTIESQVSVKKLVIPILILIKIWRYVSIV